MLYSMSHYILSLYQVSFLYVHVDADSKVKLKLPNELVLFKFEVPISVGDIIKAVSDEAHLVVKILDSGL